MLITKRSYKKKYIIGGAGIRFAPLRATGTDFAGIYYLYMTV